MKSILAAGFLCLSMFECSVFADNIFATIGTATGNQSYPGSLGLNFTVGNEPIVVTGLGVFDSGNDGLKTSLNAYIYDATTQSPLLTENNYTDATSVANLASGYRFRSEHLLLPAHFQGTVVAEGYGALEPNGNSTVAGSPVVTFSTNDVTFTGGIYGNAGSYPSLGSGSYYFAAGNFQFQIAPEPGSLLLSAFGVIGLLLVARRRLKPAARSAA